MRFPCLRARYIFVDLRVSYLIFVHNSVLVALSSSQTCDKKKFWSRIHSYHTQLSNLIGFSSGWRDKHRREKRARKNNTEKSWARRFGLSINFLPYISRRLQITYTHKTTRLRGCECFFSLFFRLVKTGLIIFILSHIHNKKDIKMYDENRRERSKKRIEAFSREHHCYIGKSRIHIP